MARIPQIQGMLLEEALLHLLRFCGYQAVADPGTDPTLRRGSAGLEVMGRGERHQIDAIADFIVPQPFANPSRLLIEAKFRADAAGIDVVRNAVGVLKDVSEFWGPQEPAAATPRYHYQYAILASAGFSKPAQKYASAQDVYLIPFANGGYFRPVLEAISRLEDFDGAGGQVALPASLSQLRRDIRHMLAAEVNPTLPNYEVDFAGSIRVVIEAVRSIEYSLLAVAMNRLPLVLTPAPGVDIESLGNLVPVRIFWDDNGWYLNEAGGNGRHLFSFDLPAEMFRRYAEQNRLSPLSAVQLKQAALSDIKALYVRNGEARLLRFQLAQNWIQQVEQQLRQAE